MYRKQLLLFVCTIATAALVGCVGELETLEGGGGGGGGADAGGGGNSAAAQTYYTNNVRPLLIAARPKGACSACHEGIDAANGRDFMGATLTDNYATLAADTRLVNGSPATSLLISRGDHTGDAFCTGPGTPYAACADNEVATVTTWISLVVGN